ncbi:hypothetical protein [Deinococcus apachensis]|uniref:hypothetical protein n=1 Tax=Deinococcus apachensis TaxID=309886 RepID=UPI0012F738FC|nr:hypothetical protein [Deinococcus apachensis]
MSESDGLEKHFEAILGRDLSADKDDQQIVLREYIALNSTNDGWVTSRETGTTGNSTKMCRQSSNPLLDVSGLSHTDANGTIQFLLEDFFCTSNPYYSLPLNFVATPRSRLPVFLTMMRRVTNNSTVQIEVMSWNFNGSPAPNVSFDWRCRIQHWDNNNGP